MKKTDEILNTVTGNLRGEARKKVLGELDEDLNAKDEFRKIKNTWALFSSQKPMPEYQLENLYRNFQQDFLVAKNKPFAMHVWLKYAAIFVVAVVLSSLFFNLTKENGGENCTSVVADNGQMSKVILPDHTVVWLNSGTQIDYNADFAVNNRDISLSGEAFFSVTKNEKLPLVVSCKGLEVKVLGTRFDVSAYPESEKVRVVLESGKVHLQSQKNKSFSYSMSPGEMISYDTSLQKMKLKKVDTHRFTSWKEGLLIFREEPMKEVIATLKRVYNVEVEVTDSEIYHSLFTATIKNETLDELLKSIGFACSVNYQIIRHEDVSVKTKVILSRK